MQETLCRRRCLLKIPKNYTGFKAKTNVFAEHNQWMFRLPKSMKFIDTGVVPKQLPERIANDNLDRTEFRASAGARRRSQKRG